MKAKAFLNEYRLNEVTLGDLWHIITSQGYTIVEINHVSNDEHVTTRIEALHLDEMVEKAKGFTMQIGNVGLCICMRICLTTRSC